MKTKMYGIVLGLMGSLGLINSHDMHGIDVVKSDYATDVIKQIVTYGIYGVGNFFNGFLDYKTDIMLTAGLIILDEWKIKEYYKDHDGLSKTEEINRKQTNNNNNTNIVISHKEAKNNSSHSSLESWFTWGARWGIVGSMAFGLLLKRYSFPEAHATLDSIRTLALVPAILWRIYKWSNYKESTHDNDEN
jgi:hypothetical protein